MTFNKPTLGGHHAQILTSQDYDRLKSECLKSKKLFEDPHFDYNDLDGLAKNTEWLRPFEICSKPGFVLNGIDKMDCDQGDVGNCWLISAVACLTTKPKLLAKVVVEQSFYVDYAGIFYFNIWYYGEWIRVIIDDKLPVTRDRSRRPRLSMMHSSDASEFWSALLEKAYAKVCGGYDALNLGSISDALEDLTGGLAEDIKTKETKAGVIWDLIYAIRGDSLAGCYIISDNQGEQKLDNGLIGNHAYSITEVRELTVKGERNPVKLVRMRNPWGNDDEWTGDWSDRSRKWSSVDERTRRQIHVEREDGEFWMSLEDFKGSFDGINICNLMPNSSGRFIQGGWKKGLNAGGRRKYRDSYYQNPHYSVNVVGKERIAKGDNPRLVISMMQKYRRFVREKTGDPFLYIGFQVWSHPDDAECNGPEYFNKANLVLKTPYSNTREVTAYHYFQPGHYIVVPNTYEPDINGQFLLRTFSEQNDQHQFVETESFVAPKHNGKTPFSNGNDENAYISQLERGLSNMVKVSDLKLTKTEIEKWGTYFQQVAGDDFECDAFELQKAVNDFLTHNEFESEYLFSLELCKTLVASGDTDLSGTLEFREFVSLWKDLKFWIKVFHQADKSRDMKISGAELMIVYKFLGFKISNSSLLLLFNRYSDAEGKISFQSFICSAVKLKNMFKQFRHRVASGEQVIHIGIRDWLRLTMYY